MSLILASTSKYRKELLERFQLKFETLAPDLKEVLNPQISPRDNALSLSKQKVEKVLESHPHSVIIGSDQICSVKGEILGKPVTHDNAMQQLKKCSGQIVHFYTGLCVYNPQSQQFYLDCDETKVFFRELDDDEIDKYLQLDQPYQCAGSFKLESMGPTLFDKVVSNDPTALIGLPMIQLSKFLKNCAMNPLN